MVPNCTTQQAQGAIANSAMQLGTIAVRLLWIKPPKDALIHIAPSAA